MLQHDQDKLLDEATAVVKEQAFYMKRSADNDNLRDALKHGSNMICELRTSLLSPKVYYELYMQVFQELQYLTRFFGETSRHNRRMSELYESVQHAGNIVPRMYLLITVGAMYISSKEAPAKDILTDMTELCKGVQHPMRGLFLRYYLTQMCKDKLPDTGSDYEREGGGDATDAFYFLLTNFVESTRLWVRLQHQGTVKDKQKRERERHDLRVLVGANLVRMAQLEGMSVAFYKEEALPKILEQIISCKDQMAQQYLLDCVIQVFSDECHLHTLDKLLETCMGVQPTVDLKPVLINLMNRLSSFIQTEGQAMPDGIEIFDLFNKHISQLFEKSIGTPPNLTEVTETEAIKSCSGGVMELSSFLELQVAFLSFTLALYPKRVEYIDTILDSTVKMLSKALQATPENKTTNSNSGFGVLEGPGVSSVVELLSMPLRTLSLSILEMAHYRHLMDFLNFQTKKEVALSMTEAVLDNHTPLDDPKAVSVFFSYISPLVEDIIQEEDEELSDVFILEQQQVGRLIHSIQHADVDRVFTMYNTAKDILAKGGHKRLVYTYPALVVSALRLIPRILCKEEGGSTHLPSEQNSPISDGTIQVPLNVKKVLQFVHCCCTELVVCNAEVSIRMFLQAAVVVDTIYHTNPVQLEPICYEFLTQALVAYEEELSDTRSQYQALIMIVGTMSSHVRCLDPGNYDNLASKITQHGAKLLKKSDQCKAVLLCSHLFWDNVTYRDSVRVLECLQKCLRIADVAVQSSANNVTLFSSILEKYVFYYEEGNKEIQLDFIQNLISLCVEHLRYHKSVDVAETAKKSLMNTVEYLRQKMASEPNSRFKGLDLSELVALA